jgi:hypothetical protein
VQADQQSTRNLSDNFVVRTDLPVHTEIYDGNCFDNTDILRIRQEYIRSRQAYILVACDAMDGDCLADGIVKYHDLLVALPPDARLQTSDSALLTWEHPESCRTCGLLKTREHSVRLSVGIVRLLGSRRGATFDDSTLLEDLVSAWFCKSSDSRDLIYAFLDLSTNRFGICPDYSMTVSLSDICSHLARNMMMHYGRLDMLQSSYIPEDMRSTRDPCFPS